MNIFMALFGLVLWLALLFVMLNTAEAYDTYDAYDENGQYISVEEYGNDEIEMYDPDTNKFTIIEPTHVYENSDNTEVEYLDFDTGEIKRVYIEKE